MTPVLLFTACFLGVSALPHVGDTIRQEQLLLRSLGLTGRPRPADSHQPRRQVPTALWRMFRKVEKLEALESQPCMVSEYGVRGNIVRYVQDQGRSLQS